MTSIEWAENECRKSCGGHLAQDSSKLKSFFRKIVRKIGIRVKEEEWSYGGACIESALKAYKSIAGDGHSYHSFGITKNILIRLLNNIPLSPIQEDDFDEEPIAIGPEDRYEYRCKRLSGLYKHVYPDGRIEYVDVNREYCVNVECSSDTFTTYVPDFNEMFPITFPYLPTENKYKVYVQSFLSDEKNGDYDTVGYLYVITPDGSKVDLNKYRGEVNGKMQEITKEEYEERLKKRIDTVSKKAAEQLLWELLENTRLPFDAAGAFNKLTEEEQKDIKNHLLELCQCYENPDFWKYNTWGIYHELCENKISDDYPQEIKEIGNYLQTVLEKIKRK